MIDLAQVSFALRNCSVRSLILLDEFGKGTLSTGSFFCSRVIWISVLLAIAVSSWISIFLTSTDCYSTDGAGLFCGVLRHLLNRGSDCPKVLVATHFHDVFDEEILDPDSIPVSFFHMQVMFTSKSGDAVELKAILNGSHDDSVASPSTTPVEDDVRESISSHKKITYLYRYIFVKSSAYSISSFLKNRRGIVPGLLCNEMC